MVRPQPPPVRRQPPRRHERMSTVFLALGLVLVVEGLALALAPSRIEGLLAWFVALPLDRRRMLGLAALAVGVLLVGLARRTAA